MVVRLISTAQTGFFYTRQRLRQGPRLSAVKYDPKGELCLPSLMGCGFLNFVHSGTKGAVRREQENQERIIWIL